MMELFPNCHRPEAYFIHDVIQGHLYGHMLC